MATGIIHTIAGNGTNSSTGNGGLAINATISPIDVCVDGMGNVFVSDNYGSIRKIDAVTGIITQVAPINAQGMCFDPLGNLYLGGALWVLKVDTSTGVIDTIAGTGLYPYNGDGIPARTANFRVYDIARDLIGNIYIADEVNQRVRMIDTFGIIHTVAGTGVIGYSGDGGLADTAMIHDPEGLAIDPCGNLYICDLGNNRIRKVTFFASSAPAITISPSPNDTICAGTPVTYTAMVTVGAGISYQWYVNGTLTAATSSTYTYTPANGDSIRCVLIAMKPCNGGLDTVSSNTVNMVVNPVTVPSIFLTTPVSAHIGSTVTVNATVADAGSSISINWYNNGVLFSTTTIPTVTYTKTAGTDNISATVIPTSVGCYDSATSQAYTIEATGLGINSVTNQSLYIYPNPAHTEITIAGENITNVTISDLLGQVVASPVFLPGERQLHINIASLPVCVYVVKITDGDGRKTVSKIVKE